MPKEDPMDRTKGFFKKNLETIQARVGTPVELWGSGCPIDEVARAAGTVSYELMCALAARVSVGEEGGQG